MVAVRGRNQACAKQNIIVSHPHRKTVRGRKEWVRGGSCDSIALSRPQLIHGAAERTAAERPTSYESCSWPQAMAGSWYSRLRTVRLCDVTGGGGVGSGFRCASPRSLKRAHSAPSRGKCVNSCPMLCIRSLRCEFEPSDARGSRCRVEGTGRGVRAKRLLPRRGLRSPRDLVGTILEAAAL